MAADAEGEDGRPGLLAAMLESEQWERARDIAAELISEEPGEPKWQRAAGQAALHLDELEAAGHHLDRALALDPEDDLAHYFNSHLHRLHKRYAEAERSVRRAIELEPGDADYWTELGWLAFERSDFGAARRCSKKARECDPSCARAATLAAAAESQLGDGTRGDPEAQVRDLEETLALDPQNDAAYHNIGVVHFNETGDYRAAERYFRRALAIRPDEPLYRASLTRALRRQDPILKVLFAPWQAVVCVIEFFSWAWSERWPLLFAVPLSPFLLVGGLLLFAFWAIAMWPPAAVYEYLGRPERRAASGALPGGDEHFVHRWPRLARFALFLAAFTTLWLVLVASFKALAFRQLLIYLLTGLLVAWIALCVAAYAIALRNRAKRERRGKELDLLG